MTPRAIPPTHPCSSCGFRAPVDESLCYLCREREARDVRNSAVGACLAVLFDGIRAAWAASEPSPDMPKPFGLFPTFYNGAWRCPECTSGDVSYSYEQWKCGGCGARGIDPPNASVVRVELWAAEVVAALADRGSPDVALDLMRKRIHEARARAAGESES